MRCVARFSLENVHCELASPGSDVYISRSAAEACVLSALRACRWKQQHSATARMAKLVDAWDLKSPARKGVPVRFRLRAPSISRACMTYLMQALIFFRNQKIYSAIPVLLSLRRGYLHALTRPDMLFCRPDRCMPNWSRASWMLSVGSSSPAAAFAGIPHLKFCLRNPGATGR